MSGLPEPSRATRRGAARKRDAGRSPLRCEVDNSPLIVFRILFGMLLAVETGGAILTGWVRETLVEPAISFPVLPFTCLQPLPGNGMYFYFGASRADVVEPILTVIQ